MLEVNDELMTPGCPQCAIKHLSAALSYSAEAFALQKRYGVLSLPPLEAKVLLARAYINLGEVLIGYESHLWFAVGLLQRAEEEALCLCSPRECSEKAREARLVLEEDGRAGVRRAMQIIGEGVLLEPAYMEAAHLEEARRELPAKDGDYLDYAGAIERIRNEFFIEEEAPAASTEDAEKGGETEMATKKAAAKAPAKKADAKAVQAACKGGKCKGKKCK